MTVEIKQLTTKIGNTYYRITKGYEFSITSTDSSVVTKIVYCRKGYNKGHQGDYPSYKVEFEDPQFKLIIPEKNIENIVVEVIKKDNKKNTPDFLPELPTEDLPTEAPPVRSSMATKEPPVRSLLGDDFLIEDDLMGKIDVVGTSLGIIEEHMDPQTNND